MLTELAAIQAIDLQKSIPDAELAEEFAREYQKMNDKLRWKWEQKEHSRHTMLTTFPSPIQPKENLTYKKGKGRKRALTGREAADAWEVDQARAKRQAAIEIDRVTRHRQIISIDEANVNRKDTIDRRKDILEVEDGKGKDESKSDEDKDQDEDKDKNKDKDKDKDKGKGKNTEGVVIVTDSEDGRDVLIPQTQTHHRSSFRRQLSPQNNKDLDGLVIISP